MAQKGLPYCVGGALISKHPAYEFCLFNVKKTALVCTTTKRKWHSYITIWNWSYLVKGLLDDAE